MTGDRNHHLDVVALGPPGRSSGCAMPKPQAVSCVLSGLAVATPGYSFAYSYTHPIRMICLCHHSALQPRTLTWVALQMPRSPAYRNTYTHTASTGREQVWQHLYPSVLHSYGSEHRLLRSTSTAQWVREQMTAVPAVHRAALTHPWSLVGPPHCHDSPHLRISGIQRQRYNATVGKASVADVNPSRMPGAHLQVATYD